MIATSINSPEIEIYAKAHSRFAEALEIVKRYLSEDLPDGQRAVDLGDELFANVLTYETKAPESSVFEVHKKYIDIQVVLDGEEIIGFDSMDELTVKSEYNDGNDCMLCNINDRYDVVRLRRGEIAIIFPGEPHAPGMSAGDKPAKVRKMIVKVLA